VWDAEGRVASSLEVDGREAPVLQANVLFRAVRVEPGTHRVRFVFRPFRGAWRDLCGRWRLVRDLALRAGSPACDARAITSAPAKS
jgi:hypothetical protein